MATATPPMSAAQQAAAAKQQDAMLAANLIANATEYYTKGSPVTAALGSQINLPMPNSGIMVGVDLHITIPCTVGSSAAMTANAIGAYGFIKNLQSTDWYGNMRHNTSGSRMHSLVGYHLGRPYNQIASSLEDSGGLSLYDLPTAESSTTPINFTLHVPLVKPGSLEGALLTQTSNGTCFINLTTLSATAAVSSSNPDAPYSAGTATLGDITVQPYWRFLMPATFAPNLLPVLSLSTAYALQDVFSAQNLTVGQQNLMNFPAARIIHGQILDFVNGDQRNFGTDVSQLQIIVNGATPVQTFGPTEKLIQQRNRLGADDVPGRYYFGYGRSPINTQVYGSYQNVLTPSSVNSGAYEVLSSEMTYPMGVPLPGLAV